MPRPGGQRRRGRSVAQQLADARRRLTTATAQVEAAGAELELIDRRFDAASQQAAELLDQLVAAQAEQDQIRRERYRVRKRRDEAAVRADRIRAEIEHLEDRKQRGLP